MTDENLVDAGERFRRVKNEEGQHQSWDGQSTVGFKAHAFFTCTSCAEKLSLLPFEDIVHGSPQRVLYCTRCEAIVPPEVSIPKVQKGANWMNKVLKFLEPQEVDREKLPREKDPSLATGLVDTEGKPLESA